MKDFENFLYLVEPDEMFLHGNWNTIDAALTPEGDIEEDIRLVGENIDSLLAYMAVCKDFPDELKKKHLSKFVDNVEFEKFARIMRIKLKSMGISKSPVSGEMKRMFVFNAVANLVYRISNMPISEIYGLLEYYLNSYIVFDYRVSMAVILRIYELSVLSDELLFLILSVCLE